MARHQRSYTQRTLNMTFADIPSTNQAFGHFVSNKSLESFSQVAQVCISELQEKGISDYTLPKDIHSSLIHYLTTMNGSNELELYIPLLSLLQLLLSNSLLPVAPSLVNHLCLFFNEVKSYEATAVVIHTTFALVDSLFHLALSRRKKSEQQDTAWIQKIFLTFTSVLNDLLARDELEELARAEYEVSKNRVSVESRVFSKRDETDLVLYLNVAICRLAKVLAGSVPGELFGVTIPSVLQHIVSEYRAVNGFDISGIRAVICMEKSVSVFELINTLCSLTVKLDLGKELIKLHCDKIQIIFYLTVLEFTQRGFQVSSFRFEEDESILGRLFKQLFEIMSNYLLHSELEAFPIQIFAIFIQQVT